MDDFSYEECLSWREDTNVNPRTGRKIERYKKTFRRIEEDCDQFIECEDLTLLRNVANSCYMDSVLTAMFAMPNKFITSKILYQNIPTKNLPKRYHICFKDDPKRDYIRRKYIQDVLKFLVRSMRTLGTIKVCTQLRKYISLCNPPQPFHGGGQQEAGELVLFLFSLFGLNLAKKERYTYLTNFLPKNTPLNQMTLSTKTLDREASLVVMIDSFELKKFKVR